MDLLRYKKTGRKRQGGFTLLEILLAVFIFSILITTIFGSFNQILGSADIIEERLSIDEMAKACLDRIILDLREIRITQSPAYIKPELHSDSDIHRVFGEESSETNRDFPRLRFTSGAHVSFGAGQPSGIAEIVYYVEAREDESLVLKRSDRLDFSKPLEENNLDPVLCENLKALKFTYFDKDGEAHPAWDSDSSDFKYETPVSIRIRIEIGTDSNFSVYQTRVQLPVFRQERGGTKG